MYHSSERQGFRVRGAHKVGQGLDMAGRAGGAAQVWDSVS